MCWHMLSDYYAVWLLRIIIHFYNLKLTIFIIFSLYSI
jgi:hypothetical protein